MKGVLGNNKEVAKVDILNKNIYLGRNMTIIQQNNIIHSSFFK